MSPIKIEPRLNNQTSRIGNWKRESLLDLLKHTEKDSLEKIKPDLSSIRKHPKVNPPKDIREGIIDPKEKIIRVRMLRSIKAAPDHVHVLELKKGKVYELPESMAKRFIGKKLAVRIYKKSKKQRSIRNGHN